MTFIDYLFILIYFFGLIVLASKLSRKINTSRDMFNAGRNSSWWLSGFSTYMTIFSAGTFVVWGGVAYRSGIVAVVIAVMLGFASIFVGKYLAGRWSGLSISSPAEYIGIRFGKPTLNFYIITLFVGKGIHIAVSLYAIAIMVVALIPLPEGHILADPNTGNLSVTYAVLIMGTITFIYTAIGGLLAVLMTDLVQFGVLSAMILIMVPLSFNSVGGFEAFVSKAPDDFFALFSDQYSLFWMILWCILNFFMIGGEWAFVQRYLSVPTVKDAKKSVYLVAVLYFLTPIIWYVPSLVYRIINPDANPEQAYILMGQHILKPGMLGIMIAALLSATMSMVSSSLNVFANVFTYDIFRSFRPDASEKKLIRVGRLFTFIYGFIITLFAVLIPYLGGAESVIVPVLTLVISPLFIPSIWGFFSRNIGKREVLISMGVTYLIAFAIKIGFCKDYVSKHTEFVDAFIGLVFPVTILLIMELILRNKAKDEGWSRLNKLIEKGEMQDRSQLDQVKHSGTLFSTMAFKILMGTYIFIGIVILILSFLDKDSRLAIYGAIFLGVPLVSFTLYYLKNSGRIISINKRNI